MSKKSKTSGRPGSSHHVFESSFESSPQPLATSSVNRTKQTQPPSTKIASRPCTARSTKNNQNNDAAEISLLQKKIHEIKLSNQNGLPKLDTTKQKDILEKLEEIQSSLDEKYRRLSNNGKTKTANSNRDLNPPPKDSSKSSWREDHPDRQFSQPGPRAGNLLVPGLLEYDRFTGYEKLKPRQSSSVSSLGIIDENSAEFNTVFQDVDPNDDFEHILQPKSAFQSSNTKRINSEQSLKQGGDSSSRFKQDINDENIDPNQESHNRSNNQPPRKFKQVGISSNHVTFQTIQTMVPEKQFDAISLGLIPESGTGLDEAETLSRPSLAQARLSMQRHLAHLCLDEEATPLEPSHNPFSRSRETFDVPTHNPFSNSRETFDVPPHNPFSNSRETFDVPSGSSSLAMAGEDSFTRLQAAQQEQNVSAFSEEFNTSGSKFLAERAEADYVSWVRSHAPIPLLANEMRDGSFSPRRSMGGASSASFTPSEYFGTRSESIGNVELCLKSAKTRSNELLGNTTVTLDSSGDRTLKMNSSDGVESPNLDLQPSKLEETFNGNSQLVVRPSSSLGNSTRAVMRRFEDDRESMYSSVSSVVSTSQLARILEQHSCDMMESGLFQEFLQEVSSKNPSKKSSQRSSPSKLSSGYPSSVPSHQYPPSDLAKLSSGTSYPNSVSEGPQRFSENPSDYLRSVSEVEDLDYQKDERSGRYHAKNGVQDPHSESAASEEFFLLHRPGSASSMREVDSPGKNSARSSCYGETLPGSTRQRQGNNTVCLDSSVSPSLSHPHSYIFYLTCTLPSSSPLTPLPIPLCSNAETSRRSTTHTHYSSSVNSILSDIIDDRDIDSERIETNGDTIDSTVPTREALVRDFQRKLSSKLSSLSGSRLGHHNTTLLNSTCEEADLTIASLIQSSTKCDLEPSAARDDESIQDLDVGPLCIGTTLEITKLIVNPCSYLVRCYAELLGISEGNETSKTDCGTDEAHVALVLFETDRFDLGPGDEKSIKIYIVPLKTGPITVQYRFRLLHTFTHSDQLILGKSISEQSEKSISTLSYRIDRVRLVSECPRIELREPALGALQFGTRPARFACREELVLVNSGRVRVPLKFVLEARGNGSNGVGGAEEFRARACVDPGVEAKYGVHVNTPELTGESKFLNLSGRLQIFLNVSEPIASRLTEEISLLLHNVHLVTRVTNTPLLLSVQERLVLQANVSQQICLKNVTNEPLTLKLWIPDDNHEEFTIEPNYIGQTSLNKVYAVQCTFVPKGNNQQDRNLNLIIDYNPRSPKTHCFPICITGVRTSQHNTPSETNKQSDPTSSHQHSYSNSTQATIYSIPSNDKSYAHSKVYPNQPPRSQTPANLSPRHHAHLRSSAPSPSLSVASADGSPLEIDSTRSYIAWTAIAGTQLADTERTVNFKLRNRNSHREKLRLALLNRNDCYKILKDKDPVTELKISMSPMEYREVGVTFVPSSVVGPMCNAIIVTRVNASDVVDGEIPKRVIPLYGFSGRSKVDISGVQKDINQRMIISLTASSVQTLFTINNSGPAPAFALLRSSNSRLLHIDSPTDLLLPPNSTQPSIVELRLGSADLGSEEFDSLRSGSASDVVEIARVTIVYGEESARERLKRIVGRLPPNAPALSDYPYPYLNDIVNMFPGQSFCNTRKLQDTKDMLRILYTKDIREVTIGILMEKADIELLLLDNTVVFEELNSTLYKTHLPSE